jgi:uncharacterized repeat protein (TIGR03806 family)
MRLGFLLRVGLAGLAGLAGPIGCGAGALEPAIPDGPAPEDLSELGLMRLEDGAIVYAEGVLPYRLTMPLFSDYTTKDRAIYVPPGATVGWEDRWTLDFPVGTAILKTFSLPADLRDADAGATPIETRLLLRTSAGWEAWPYVWDLDAGEARLALSGTVRPSTLIDRAGETRDFSYLVPQRNQCQECHELASEDGADKAIVPIGPTARNLHPDDLAAMVDAGWIPDAPDLAGIEHAADWGAHLGTDPATLPPEDLDRLARDYLDVNCAHCHNPRATNGVTSQLFLDWENEDPFRLGICKRPGSAAKGTGGRTWDIVPGDPDASILVYRLETEDPGSMMPDIGRALAHHEGVDVLRAWIAAMPPEACGE